MRRPALLLALLAIAACACQRSDSDPGPLPRVAAPPGATTARPASVTTLVGIRDPDAVRRAVAGIANRVLAVRTREVALGDHVGPALGLTREAARELDFSRPSWFVSIGGGADDSHYLVLLPAADPDRFWRTAARTMRVRERRGGFAVLTMRDAEDAKSERLVAALGEDHVVIVDDPKAFELAGAYVAELADARPAADIELRVFIEALLTETGAPREQLVTLLMSGAAVALVGEMAAQDVATTAELARGFRSWFEPLVGMREVAVQLNLGPRDIEARVTAEPGADAAARAVVERQRPGAPMGLAELPGDSWLVWTDRARADDGKLVDIGVVITGEDPPAVIEELRELAGDPEVFTGDFTIAGHPAAVGNGIGVSLVAGIRDRARAEAAILAFCRKHMAPVAGAVPGQRVFEATLPAGPTQELARLVGPRPRVAIAFAGDRLLASAGAVPERSLARMLDPATPRSTSLLARRALATRVHGDQRTVGLAFVSLVDLAGQLVAVAPMELRRQLAGLAGQHDDGGVMVSWGLDATGKRFELEGRIPIEHASRALGPVFREAALARLGVIRR